MSSRSRGASKIAARLKISVKQEIKTESDIQPSTSSKSENDKVKKESKITDFFKDPNEKLKTNPGKVEVKNSPKSPVRPKIKREPEISPVPKPDLNTKPSTSQNISFNPVEEVLSTAPTLSKKETISIYWFRKCQRLHDNPALIYALENSSLVYPVFILDPWFVKNAKVGPNRWRFLQQSLSDLHENLLKKNSRLFLVRGSPLDVFKQKLAEWKVNLLCFESDTEPYAKQRDNAVIQIANELNCRVVTKCSNTLYDPSYLYKKNGNKLCLSYQGFGTLLSKIGEPQAPLPEPNLQFPKLPQIGLEDYNVPTLAELNVDESKCGACLYPGGESEALKRLQLKFQNESWVSSFEKPNTSPNSLEPSTTVLSPYLKFGNLSPRLFYQKLKAIYTKQKKHSKPPVSLEGQLLWREFFYFVGAFSPNFDRVEGNPICKQIKWDEEERLVRAWREARTGFPFIDAIMTQLRDEGWIHHLARHAVACFLTRGDLYQSWTKGQEVFEEYLLDADWSLNAANWQWLSASAFFHQYWRVYSPIQFGKKTDKNGDYIKKYLPVLKNMPAQYIYEPWMAPPNVQRMAKCVIGQDYPTPIVDHNIVSKKNMSRMKEAYESSGKETAKKDNDEDNQLNLDSEQKPPQKKRQRVKT